MLSRKLVIGLLLCGTSYSLPTSPIIHEGTVEIHYDNLLAEIHSGAYAELHWDDFSIRADETVRFLQKDQTSVALNRVLSLNPSNLFGRLESNGQIILINPNGVLVGKDAYLDTGSFIASTLDLIGNFHFAGDSSSSIVNEGTIVGRDGDIVLLSQRVENHGKIEASNGSALIGAAKEIYYHPNAKEKLFIRLSEEALYEGCGIENSGTISALRAELKADGNLYAYAINHSGGIDALGTQEIGGEIFLVAEEGLAQVSGSLHANGGEIRLLGQRISLIDEANLDVSGENQGGTILIGGDFQGQNPDVINSEYTYVGNDVEIHADATAQGNGGRVIVWGSDVNAAYGSITAKGGVQGGDGGFVEISSPKSLVAKAAVDTSAYFGKAGTLLLDPCVVTIATGGTTVGVTTTVPPPQPLTYGFGVLAAANIDPADIALNLMMNDVTINATTSGSAGAGSITFVGNGMLDTITWASGTKLTLAADGFISIQNRIVSSSALVPATTIVVEINAPIVEIGNLGVASTSQSQISVASGQVKVTSPTSFSVYPSILAPNGINAGTAPATAGSVDITTGSLLLQGTSAAATSPALIIAYSDINIRATGNIDITAGSSFVSDAEAQIYTINEGNITISGNLVTLIGGDGTGSSSAVITAREGGDINVTALGTLTITGGSTTGGAGDGNAAIAAQNETMPFVPKVGSVSVIAEDISMNSGIGSGGIGNAAVIGIINGCTGPVTVATDPNFGMTVRSNESNPAVIGTSTNFGSSGNVTVNTAFISIIGSFDPTAVFGVAMVTAAGDLLLNAPGGISIRGGNGMSNNFAGIIVDTANSLTVNTDAIFLTGGTTLGSHAVIESQMGSATVNAATIIILQADMAYAGIGAATVGGTGDLRVTTHHLDFIGGNAPGAYAGVYTGDPTTMVGGNGNVYVNIINNGDINSLPSMTVAGAPGLIGTYGTLPTNSINVQADGVVNLYSATSESIISTLGGAINITALTDINLFSLPGVEVTISVGALGNSDLTLISGNSIAVNSIIQNLGAGNINIVVDANFPRPFFGGGVFSLGLNGILTTNGGAIRIFTSQQSLELNQILGLINGQSFNPGSLFVDTNQEIWCTYYPSTSGGFPFTVFYKDCLQLLMQQAEVVVAELLTNFHPFNEFPGWWDRFTISSAIKGSEYSTLYFLRRRYSPYFLHPKSYTVDLHNIL